MARVTIADLVERLDAMQEEIDALRAHIDGQPPIQYVRELRPPKSLSSPLDFGHMAAQLSEPHSYYDEEGDEWGPGVYL